MLTIRKAQDEDIELLYTFEAACFSDPWSRKSLRDTLHEERACMLIAENDGVACGYLNATWVLDEMNLNRVCVLPEMRRCGAGSLLVKAMFDAAKENAVTVIFLEVRESNEAAQRVYLRHGFTAVGRRPGFYQNPPEAGIIMTAAVDTGENV